MKFLITESMMEKLVKKYIDSINYNKIIKKQKRPGGYSNVIFFVRKGVNDYADIKYEKWSGKCYINDDLIDEINKLFSIDPDDYEIDAKDIVCEWVENKLNLKEIPFHNLYVVSGWLTEILNIQSPEEEE